MYPSVTALNTNNIKTRGQIMFYSLTDFGLIARLEMSIGNFGPPFEKFRLFLKFPAWSSQNFLPLTLVL